MSILRNTKAPDTDTGKDRIDGCVYAWEYANYRIQRRELTRIYVRSADPTKTLEYDSKYKYVPVSLRRGVAKTYQLPAGCDAEFVERKLKELGMDYVFPKEQVKRVKRHKQKFEAIGWYCYDCKKFFSDEEIEQYKKDLE